MQDPQTKIEINPYVVAIPNSRHYNREPKELVKSEKLEVISTTSIATF
jgi:hypothetical protein